MKLIELPHWAIFTVVLVLVYAALSMVWRVVWKRIEAFARQTATQWDDLIVEALRLPVRLLIAIGAVAIALQTLPESFQYHLTFVYGIKMGLIVAVLWMIDRVFTLFVKSKAVLGGITDSTRILILTISRSLLISLLILGILDTAGISITPILASLGVGSLAVALALQDTLGTFLAGFIFWWTSLFVLAILSVLKRKSTAQSFI